jgi:DNA (cytosine-5)-methyltransferase 1
MTEVKNITETQNANSGVSAHRFPYRWTLKNAKFTKDKGKVFSCFAGGGGSTMGYKLAGFDVLGCNEVDKKMLEAYKENHKPKYAFLESIQTFKLRNDLPQELYELDILDGSPPCSSFSIAGKRERDWGKEKTFREGQKKQVLDTLFFDFIDLAKKLQPKIVVAENVKGLLLGNAITYVREIYKQFDLAGYYCQHFLLDARKMGVPQRRERVFFICLRKDLAKPFLKQINIFDILPEIKLYFNEPIITYKEFSDSGGSPINEYRKKAWDHKKPTDRTIADSKGHAGMKVSNFSCSYIYEHKPLPTLTGKGKSDSILYSKPLTLSDNEFLLGGTFPLDYNSTNIGYIVGMSAPPVMVANIATEIYLQWLSIVNLNNKKND